MKFKIGNIFEDWGRDICCRCGLECEPRYRICYQLDKTGVNGNEILDEEFSLCRFCIPKVISNWKNYCDEVSEKNEIHLIPDRKEWKEINKAIIEGGR